MLDHINFYILFEVFLVFCILFGRSSLYMLTHQRRLTVVLVAPPHQLRSAIVRPHHLRERLREIVLHGNGCDAFCWLPYFDISTSTPSGMACVLDHRRRQTAANFPRRVGVQRSPVDDIGLALEDEAAPPLSA